MKLHKQKYRLTFPYGILGSTPKDKDVFATHIQKKVREEHEKGNLYDPKTGEIMTEERLKELQAEELPTIDEIEEKAVTGFHRDDKGLFIYEYVVKGFLKHAGLIMRTEHKLKAASARIRQYVFVNPRKLYFVLNDKNVTEIVDMESRPLRANTPQGPRVCLAKSERLADEVSVEIEVVIIENPDVNLKMIEGILDYGQFEGLGQWRSGKRFGSFTWEKI